MITCNNCGFSVTDQMKFAIKNNTCCACGFNLFSNKDLNLMVHIQSKISSERFASDFTADMLFDVSMFMFNEFKHGMGYTMLIDALAQHKKRLTNAEGADTEEISDEIRKEIEEEFKEELAQLTTTEFTEDRITDDDVDSYDNDIDINVSEDYIAKAARLKAKAQSQRKIPVISSGGGPKSGTMVRRA